VYGPLSLFSVTDFRPADILSDEVVNLETQIQSARIVKTLPVPKLQEVSKEKGNEYTFSGTGQPNSMVVLLLSGDQTAVYTGDIDKNGNWKVSHSQEGFKMSEGNHSLVVYGYDQNLKVRTDAASEQYFKVTTTWWDKLVQNVDVAANWSMVIIILLGVFLTFLTI